MKLDKREKEIILISLITYLNKLKDKFEETKDINLIDDIEKTNKLINKVLEGK